MTALIGVCIYVYWWSTKTYGQWESKGVYSLKPVPFFGNMWKFYSGQKSWKDFYVDLYHKFQGHKFAIVYELREPILYIKDVELIKRVLVSDYEHFTHNGIISDTLLNIDANNFGLINTKGRDDFNREQRGWAEESPDRKGI